MAFVIYERESTLILRDTKKHGKGKEYHATEAAAKAALSRAYKYGHITNPDDYAIAEDWDFLENIEKTVERVNIMSGKPYKERVNTPACCSPSCETYWSM
jgi:hypothetical protein